MGNDLIVDNDFFSVESIPGVAILRITGNPLYKLIDLQAKAALFDCMTVQSQLMRPSGLGLSTRWYPLHNYTRPP